MTSLRLLGLTLPLAYGNRTCQTLVVPKLGVIHSRSTALGKLPKRVGSMTTLRKSLPPKPLPLHSMVISAERAVRRSPITFVLPAGKKLPPEELLNFVLALEGNFASSRSAPTAAWFPMDAVSPLECAALGVDVNTLPDQQKLREALTQCRSLPVLPQ